MEHFRQPKCIKTSRRQSRISKNFPGGETPGPPLKAAVSNAAKGHCQGGGVGRGGTGGGRMDGGTGLGGTLLHGLWGGGIDAPAYYTMAEVT